MAQRIGANREALFIVETAKAQTFLEHVTGNAWRLAPDDPPILRALVRRERKLREVLAQQQTRLALQMPEPLGSSLRGVDTVPGLTRAELDAHARAYEATAERLRLARGGLKGNPSLPGFDVQALRAAATARWGNAWTALDYFFADGYLYIACVEPETSSVARARWTGADRVRLNDAAAAQGDLRELVYNRTLHSYRGMAQTDTLAYLAERLIPEHVRAFSTERTLLIAPHGLLHQLPFHALEVQGMPLLERFTFAYTPSLQAFVELARGDSAHPNRHRALVCGVSQFSNAPLLPFARSEVRALQNVLHPMVLFQDKATRARLVEWNQHGTLARFEMVHFATHAILDGKAPHWSRILLGDEPLTLLDITALELNARLVTLSACSSALGSGGIGDEWIALARAFSYAGAHAVVASLWIVDDASTAALMGLFYTYLERGELIGAALRHAQLDLRARGLSAYHRAPFRAMGDV